MSRMFEFCDDQDTPLEVAERDGRPLLRLRRNTPVTPKLVQELNELIGEDAFGQDAPHPPTVTVEISPEPYTVIIVIR